MSLMEDIIDEEMVYTSDSDFYELQDKDKTTEMYGYICSVETPVVVGDKKYNLFKFGVSNGDSKKIMCLMRGKELIDKYQSEIVINRKIHMDGAHCKASKFPSLLDKGGYTTFELVIQESATILFLGMHEVTPVQPPLLPPREVDFETIIDFEGSITINGYIWMEFAAIPSRFQNATYGCGSITDGVHKVTVNISNFQPVGFKKGTAVKVVGEVNNNSDAPLTITCKTSSMITEREGIDPLTSAQLMRGNKTYKRRAE